MAKTVYPMDDLENMYTGKVYAEGHQPQFEWRNHFLQHPKKRPEFARSRGWQMWYQGNDLFVGEYPGTHIARIYGNLYEGGASVWRNPITRFLFQDRFLYWSRVGKVSARSLKDGSRVIDMETESPNGRLSWVGIDKHTETKDIPFNLFETPAPPSDSTHESNMKYLVDRYLNTPALRGRWNIEPSISMEGDIRPYSTHFRIPIPSMDECLEVEKKLLAKAVLRKLAH